MIGGLLLDFQRRNPDGERVYEVQHEGVLMGQLFVWPHGGACTFDPEGSIVRDLSTLRGEAPEAVVAALKPLAPKAQAQEALF